MDNYTQIPNTGKPSLKAQIKRKKTLKSRSATLRKHFEW